MGVWDYFDSVVVVSLANRADRFAQTTDELKVCGIDDPEWWPAHPFVPPSIGCLISHVELWTSIARGQCGERVLIFEDDVQALTRAMLLENGYGEDSAAVRVYDQLPDTGVEARLGRMLPEVPPDFELLYLGGGYAAPPRGRVSPHVIRNAGMLTTHAYALSRAFADRARWASADTLLSGFCASPAVRSYTLSPRLFVQRPGRSDITGEVTGFAHSMVDPTHEQMV